MSVPPPDRLPVMVGAEYAGPEVTRPHPLRLMRRVAGMDPVAGGV